MKYRFFSLAAAVLTLTLSCGKEEPTGGPTDRPAGGETDKPEVLPPLNEGEIAFAHNKGIVFYVFLGWNDVDYCKKQYDCCKND